MIANEKEIKDSEIHDASIIRESEHPKFSIGDSITNGKVDYKVLGFKRTVLGLCYVLENEYTRTSWLTEQVDVMFKLKPTPQPTPQEFIKEHKVAVDFLNGVAVPMIATNNAERAVKLAEYNLASFLLTLHENARIECLEHIVYNFENKSKQ